MQVSELKNLLLHVKPAINSNAVIPVMSNVCFTGESIYAFDGVMSVCLPFETPFSCAVPGETVLSIVGTFPEESDVKFLYDKDKLTLRCGRSKSTLPTLGKDVFLYDPDRYVDTDRVFSLTDKLQEALKACLVGVGDTNYRVSLTGVTVTKQGDLWSTDNVSLTAIPDLHGSEDTFVMPKAFVEKIASMQGKGRYVCVGDNYVTLTEKDGTVLVMHTLMTGEPEDWRKVIDRSFGKCSMASLPEGVIDTVLRALAVTRKEQKKRLRIEVKNGSMTLSASGTGSVKDRYDCDVDNVDCYVQLEAFVRAVKNFEAWKIGFSEKGALAFISDGDWRHYIAYSEAED